MKKQTKIQQYFSSSKRKIKLISKSKKAKKNGYFKTYKTRKVTGHFRSRTWGFLKQIHSDFIFRNKIKCIRTIWEQSYYTYDELMDREIQNELEYWKYDIKKRLSDGKGGLYIEWFDSYVPQKDVINV